MTMIGAPDLVLEDVWTSQPEHRRFWSKVDVGHPSDCWEWQAARFPLGYGHFRAHGYMYAHRYAYAITRGPIPDGLSLDHLCRNPPCVNPWHLEPVTHRENVLRGKVPGPKPERRKVVGSHCSYGHEMTAENTFTPRAGRPICRICKRAYERERRRRSVTGSNQGRAAASVAGTGGPPPAQGV
jgi:hypothetical protein